MLALARGGGYTGEKLLLNCGECEVFPTYTGSFAHEARTGVV